MDEGKSMLEVGTYHEYIVNLQGVTYQTDSKHENLTQVINTCNIVLKEVQRKFKIV